MNSVSKRGRSLNPAFLLSTYAAFGVASIALEFGHRKRYDAEHTIEIFAARFRDEIDIHEFTSDLQTLVRQTMEPSHVSLWIREKPL